MSDFHALVRANRNNRFTWLARVVSGVMCPASTIFPGRLVVVADVISDQLSKMLLVQRDDMAQDLAPASSNPAFRDFILPGCLDARPLGFQTCRLQ